MKVIKQIIIEKDGKQICVINITKEGITVSQDHDMNTRLIWEEK